MIIIKQREKCNCIFYVHPNLYWFERFRVTHGKSPIAFRNSSTSLLSTKTFATEANKEKNTGDQNDRKTLLLDPNHK